EKARQKWLRTEVPKIRRTVRKFRAILYFQDESNVSLTAFLGKTWGICGQTPRVPVTGARGGVSAMSALSGQGRLLWLIRKVLQHNNGRTILARASDSVTSA